MLHKILFAFWIEKVTNFTIGELIVERKSDTSMESIVDIQEYGISKNDSNQQQR